MELGSRDAFARMETLGIEEEFYIVDADGRPTSGIDDLVYGRDPPAEVPGGRPRAVQSAPSRPRRN